MLLMMSLMMSLSMPVMMADNREKEIQAQDQYSKITYTLDM